MATSATGRENNPRRPSASSGFTLLEVLVVLVIIGVVVGFAVLSIDTGPEELRREGTRLASLLELTGEEAVMNGREYRLVLHRHGYAFEVLQSGAWQESDDELLRPRQLPDGLELELLLEGQPQQLTDPQPDDDQPRQPVVLYLLSSGELSPFELTVSDGGAGRSTISSDGLNISSEPLP